MIIMTLLTSQLAIMTYDSITSDFIYNSCNEYIDMIKTDLTEDTIKYHIETNDLNEKYDNIVSKLSNIIAYSDIDGIQIVKTDALGVYYYYDSTLQYELGTHQAYEKGIFTDTGAKQIGNTLHLVYPLENETGLYGYINIIKSNQTLTTGKSEFSLSMLSDLIIVFLTQAIVYLVILYKKVIKPINELSDALDNYTEQNKNDTGIDNLMQRKSNYVSRLNIKTNNEIEDICDNLKLLEYDINKYIDNLSSLKETKINAHIIELIASMQSMILKQMCVDFKSFLPILTYYFKADKVIFITKEDTSYTLMAYDSETKKYNKYSTPQTDDNMNSLMGSQEYKTINLRDLPSTLKAVVLKNYTKKQIALTTFGDTTPKHKWEVLIIRSKIEEIKSTDIIIRAIESCIQSFFKDNTINNTQHKQLKLAQPVQKDKQTE